MRPTAVEVVNVSKKYRISSVNSRRTSSKEVLNSLLMKPVNRLKAAIRGRALNTDVDFWPLKDISFNIYQGETVGIIGPNGSGKSTLLRIIANITAPTKGYVRTRGRVATLLEIGSGFNPELSGRDNIFVNAMILGMSEADINRNFDSILDFAGIHEFIDTPIKRYSSGMMVRLAFSVAVHLKPEILIIDEVLAVGDVAFVQKSFNKVKEIARSGTTVILVSHMTGFISELCDRAIWLEKGQIVESGDVQTVATNYQNKMLGVPVAPGNTVENVPKSNAEENVLNSGEDKELGSDSGLIETVQKDLLALYSSPAFALISQTNQFVTVSEALLALVSKKADEFVGLPLATTIPDERLAFVLARTMAERLIGKTQVQAFGKKLYGVAHPLYNTGLNAGGDLVGTAIVFFPEIHSVEIAVDMDKRIQVRRAELVMAEIPDKQADIQVRFTYDVRKSLRDYMFSLEILNLAGVNVFYTNDDYLLTPVKREIGIHTMTLTIPSKILSAGYYTVTFGFWCPETRRVEDYHPKAISYSLPEHDSRIEKLGLEWPSVLYLPDQLSLGARYQDLAQLSVHKLPAEDIG